MNLRRNADPYTWSLRCHLRQGTWDQRKEFMARNGSESIQVLINHWRWLEANGYKQQAASCKRQAASLTRKHYNDIQEYTGKKKNENK